MTEPASPRPPDDKARIEGVVAACIEALERGEVDPATRLCADDRDLLTRVQRRLAHLAARGLIPDSETLPASIGPYRVLRELGSGGMGHVYLADQIEPVRRQVALKVIKLGMDTREVVARFQAERQALALMNHPNIAQVFDAGITPEGRPYFVMEYVAGHALTSFCDARRLATEARVRLMATVCRAVQHAHDRGFIHRDLKPSNILVAEREGGFVPKVIDFGVAKATAAAAESAATQAASLRTRADQVLGTPEYMSPEQMSSGGIDVDTRTDVYSLGVTLYELLCGELPFDSRRLRSAGRNELERILRDELPTQPSKRLSEVRADVVAARGGERWTVQRSVAGELDWITLKALAKQREHRYPSALALAEDLERWLRHEPVHAAPPGRTYRLRKFVRRHSVGVTVASIVLVALVGGLAVSVRAAMIANAARERESAALADMRAFFVLARDAVGNIVDVAGERLAEVPQAEVVRRQLLADAMRFYEQLRTRQPHDAELQLARVAAGERIGKLQRQLGEPAAAFATLRQCVEDATALRAAHPRDAKAAMAVVTAGYELAAAAGSLGRSADAKAALGSAIDALDAARGLPDVTAAAADTMEARLLASLAIRTKDDNERALALFVRALAAFDRAGGADPAAVKARARAAIEHAEVLTRLNRLDDAAIALADAAARVRALPDDRSTRGREAEALVQASLSSVLRRLDRRAEARVARQRAIALYEQLAADHPGVPSHTDDAAAGWYFLGQLDEDEAKLPEATAAVTKSVQLREALVARFPAESRIAMHCARSLLFLADLQIQTWQHHGGDAAPADATLARAVALVDPLQREHADDFEVLQTYCSVHAAVALLHSTRQAHADALREHDAIRDVLTARLAVFETLPAMHYQLAITGNNRFQALYLMQRPEDALAAAEEGRKHLERGLALDARNQPLRLLVPTLLGRLAAARFATGDFDGGVATLFELCERPVWGTDAKEQGALLLSSRLRDVEGHEQREAWLARAAQHLRSAIAARGPLAAARERPPQRTGVSHVGSRLRDLDLRLALADTAGALDLRDEQQQVLAEAIELEATMPGVSDDRVRNLFSQRAEIALARGDAPAAEAAADELLQRVGDRSGASYLLAVLFARSIALVPGADAKMRLGDKAVACLRRALDAREVRRDAASHPNFAPLRGRPDYEQLLAQ